VGLYCTVYKINGQPGFHRTKDQKGFCSAVTRGLMGLQMAKRKNGILQTKRMNGIKQV
jgi:hypothetical protein